jgi:hypothetical protein
MQTNVRTIHWKQDNEEGVMNVQEIQIGDSSLFFRDGLPVEFVTPGTHIGIDENGESFLGVYQKVSQEEFDMYMNSLALELSVGRKEDDKINNNS